MTKPMCNYHLITKIIRESKKVNKQTNERQLTNFLTIVLVTRPWYRGSIVSEGTIIDTGVNESHYSLRRPEIYFCGIYSLNSRLPVQ